VRDVVCWKIALRRRTKCPRAHTLTNPSPPLPNPKTTQTNTTNSCVELGDKNPLVQIHDQGAGGNCNVVKEIIYPLGGEIDVRAVKVRVFCG
jgi:hypothetical protein